MPKRTAVLLVIVVALMVCANCTREALPPQASRRPIHVLPSDESGDVAHSVSMAWRLSDVIVAGDLVGSRSASTGVPPSINFQTIHNVFVSRVIKNVAGSVHVGERISVRQYRGSLETDTDRYETRNKPFGPGTYVLFLKAPKNGVFDVATSDGLTVTNGIVARNGVPAQFGSTLDDVIRHFETIR
jgi:hypothetical protein